MKKISLLPVICISIVIASCNNTSSSEAAQKAKADSAKADSLKHGKFVIALVKDTTSHGDNYMDVNGKKQGHWIITNDMKHLTDYDDKAKIEEGYYSDNMKEGEWIEYNPNGSIKSKMIFKDDKPVQ